MLNRVTEILIPTVSAVVAAIWASRVRQSNQSNEIKIKHRDELLIELHSLFTEVCSSVKSIFLVKGNEELFKLIEKNTFSECYNLFKLFQKQSDIIKCYFNKKEVKILEQFVEVVSDFNLPMVLLAGAQNYVKPEMQGEFIRIMVEREVILSESTKARIKFEQRETQMENLLREKLKPILL